MSRWFRHYTGMMRDPKFSVISIRTKQPVERVLFVWGCILESAAEQNDGGRFNIEADEIAYFLHCKPSPIQAIRDAFEREGLVKDSTVTKWTERQFESDTSAARTREWRHRQRHGDNGA